MVTSTSLLTSLTEAPAPGSLLELVSRRTPSWTRAELPPVIAALTGVPGSAPARPVMTAAPQAKTVLHDPEFSRLVVHGMEYRFKQAQQRQVIKALFHARERAGGRDGAGVSGAALAEVVDSQACRFHVSRLFYGHKAWNTIIRATSKGMYALFLNEVTEQPQNDQPRQPKRNRRRSRIGRHARDTHTAGEPPGTGEAAPPPTNLASSRGR
jgi:hypothetical protein